MPGTYRGQVPFTPRGKQEATMLYFDGFFGLVVIGLWIFCFIDVLLTPETSCRTLPKLAWVFIVLLLPTLGSIGWLVAGRPWNRTAEPASLRTSSRWSDQPQPARRAATRGQTAPDDDEEFLAGLRQRAEEQRRRAHETNPREQDERPDAT